MAVEPMTAPPRLADPPRPRRAFPVELAEAVAGDLEEEYRTPRPTGPEGAPRADLWYWGQALALRAGESCAACPGASPSCDPRWSGTVPAAWAAIDPTSGAGCPCVPTT